MALGMGKSRNEQLADHYLEAAGVAGVWVAPDGECSALRKVSTDPHPRCSIYCCATFAEAIRLARSTYLFRDAPIEHRAERMGIGITEHPVVVERALAAVAVVNQTFAQMQATGGMREINAAFKVARRADPSLRYHDYLHQRKADMLAAMAREIGR